MAVAQKPPDYKAEAGMLKIGPDPERRDAEIFHVAYTLKGVTASRVGPVITMHGCRRIAGRRAPYSPP
jgi:hypothetical protein